MEERQGGSNLYSSTLAWLHGANSGTGSGTGTFTSSIVGKGATADRGSLGGESHRSMITKIIQKKYSAIVNTAKKMTGRTTRPHGILRLTGSPRVKVD
jgi:hypothetical protein